MLRALLAEFLGTFFFVSIILFITTMYPGNIVVPLVIGLALALSIYFAFSTSLGSLNPAVSVALYARGDLSGGAAALYIVAELLGAVCAFLWWKYMTTHRKKSSPTS
jgi:glycerol uptake facilitator-like aquaporin